MHEFGVSIVWLSLQVTIVAVGAALFYWCVRNKGPLLRSLVISSSLIVTLMLASLMLSPWPRWNFHRTQQSNQELVSVEKSLLPNKTTELKDSPAPQREPVELESVWSSAWAGFVAGLDNKQPVDSLDASLAWPVIIAFLFLGGIVLGFLRLCVGYILLRREVKHAIILENTVAQEYLDGFLMEQDYQNIIHLRETTRLATAAVVGWWRPVILIPATWQTWSAEQLKAVLTHELAHIQQRDFLTNLCAEISRSIFFYHPLMHWLVSRLRLEQELAADAAAARVAGGSESYLVILAEMAMAQSNRGVRGPARAFLPTHSTFLRRIDMLKDKTPFRGAVSRSARAIAISCILMIGLLAVGLRGESISVAQDASPSAMISVRTKSASEKFRIDFVPSNALAVIALRPAEILAQDSMKPLRNLIKQELSMNKPFGVVGLNPNEIETATVVFVASEPPKQIGFAIVIHANKVIDRKAAMTKSFGKNVEVEYKGQGYLKNTSGLYPEMRMYLDDRTVIYTGRESVMEGIIDTIQRGSTSRWSKQWQSIENDSVAGLIDLRVARAIVGDEPARIAAANAPMLGLISPIWENTELASLGLNIKQEISLNVSLSQDQNGESVKNTLDALLTLSRNMLDQMKRGMAGDSVQERLTLMSLLNIAEKMMKSTKVTQSGEDVTLTSALSNNSGGQLIAVLVPAFLQAQKAASRSRSLNNIKQIVLALHVYHDKHKHFPPAVLLGPDGKTPYSWRVALLPFLDQQALYDEYNRNEPWDSEHNKKVLAKMPDVYRCPADDRGENNTSYFVIVGNNTAFGKLTNRALSGLLDDGLAAGNDGLEAGSGFGIDQKPADGTQGGLRFRDVVDGTSNTIAVVETKREIPWTKPEDITYDGRQLPKLGGFYPGGFNVGFCDGAARFLSEKTDPTALKNLIQINDGNVVDLNNNQ